MEARNALGKPRGNTYNLYSPESLKNAAPPSRPAEPKSRPSPYVQPKSSGD